jgi:hypothetical protein
MNWKRLCGCLAAALIPTGARADIPTRQVAIDARLIEVSTPVVGKLGVDIFGGYEFVSREFRDTFKGGSVEETTDFHTFVIGGTARYGKTALTGLYQGSFSESGVFDGSLKAFEVSLSHQILGFDPGEGLVKLTSLPALVVAPHVEYNHDRVGGVGFDAFGLGIGARLYPTGPEGPLSVYAGITYFPVVSASGYGTVDGDDGFKAAAGVDVRIPSLHGVLGLGYLFRRVNGSGPGFDLRQDDHRVHLILTIRPRLLNLD